MPMRLAIPLLSILVFTLGATARADEPATPKASNEKAPTFATEVLPFLKAHCFHCHGTEDGKNKADLTLTKYQDDLSLQQDRKVWENVVHMLQSGETPPMEPPKPPAADIESAIDSIEGVLANLDCTQPP